MQQRRVSFAHISDTHIGPSDDFTFYGKNPTECGHKLIAGINSLRAPIDFIIHTGDVVNGASDASFIRASRLFSLLSAPVFFVQGNHDGDAPFFSRFLASQRGISMLDDGSTSYAFSIKQQAFLSLDCRGPAFEDAEGLFTPAHEAAVTQFLSEAGHSPIVLFIHFPPLPLDSQWIDQGMLLRNGERLHELLRSSAATLKCVLFGHVHRRTSVLRDGILYASAPSPVCQFSADQSDMNPRFEPDIPVSYNLVTLAESALTIKEMTQDGDYQG